MKKCTYCGLEYPAEATVCAIDMEPLVVVTRPSADQGAAVSANGGENCEVSRAAAKRDMMVGGLWCGGGILVTALTYKAASGGGSYVVAWGAIIFGGIQFLRGALAK
jgi:hypothetical protein